MDRGAALPGSPAAPAVPLLALPGTAAPFMNNQNMEEISFWISTKQAPCLYNYDNVIKKQFEQVNCPKPKSVQSVQLETPIPNKKKKRKLSLLDDASVSTVKQPNVYFDTSQTKTPQPIMGSCHSATLDSDLDFNIKNLSVKNKRKRVKLNKSCKSSLQKKKTLVTSTPKTASNLRRSQRKAQSNGNNKSINDSFDIFNVDLMKGKCNNIPTQDANTEMCAAEDQQTLETKSAEKVPVKFNNGDFDDMSDVSGFTANYIRSTKMHSVKKVKDLRHQGKRTFVNESPSNVKTDGSALLMCFNKSTNTGMPNSQMLNCSTDSSQNIINLVTLNSVDKSTRINKSTSVLKFMDSKTTKNNMTNDKGVANKLNVSFNSKSSGTSRYPKRYKNSSAESSPIKFEKKSQQKKITLDKRSKSSKTMNDLKNSGRKENPDEKFASRTRSGKSLQKPSHQVENAVLVLSNSMEPPSSPASMNVATPRNQTRRRTRQQSMNKQADRKEQEQNNGRRESLRDKSGFAACFSESDDDNVPIKDKKFFC